MVKMRENEMNACNALTTMQTELLLLLEPSYIHICIVVSQLILSRTMRTSLVRRPRHEPIIKINMKIQTKNKYIYKSWFCNNGMKCFLIPSEKKR